MDSRSWLLLADQDPRHRLPDDLRERDALAARDVGWVEQARPLIAHYAPSAGRVLDPFAGFGTTLLAAALEGRSSRGYEIDPMREALARTRLQRQAPDGGWTLHAGALPRPDAEVVADCDLLLTSVPYFAPNRPGPGADPPGQLYASASYAAHLDGLGEVFHRARDWLRPGAYCVALAQNVRVGAARLALAWDLSARLEGLFERCEERLLVYPKPSRPLPPAEADTDRSHEYALVFRHVASAVAVEPLSQWLQDWLQSGLRFVVHGGFARHWRDPAAPAPADLDLLFDPAQPDLNLAAASLLAEGFALTAWGERVRLPFMVDRWPGRYALRAERVDRDGRRLRIDLGWALDDCDPAWAVANPIWVRGLPLLPR